MTRAKAYLFGGVEIRWQCDPSLIDGDDVPEEATFHFANGLEDYLKATINGATLVHPDIFAGKSEKKGGHGSVEWAVGFVADADPFLSSYCNTIPTPDGGTHEVGAAQRHHQGHQGSCRAHQPGQARRGRHQRRRDGGRRLHGLGVHPRAGIPGPDQGPPRHQRGDAHRRERDQGPVRSLARRQPGAGQQAARFRDRARRRAHPPQAGKGNLAQERGAQAPPPRQARRLHLHRRRGRGNVHRRGRQRGRLRQAGARPRDAGDAAAARKNPQRRLRRPRQACAEPAALRPDPGARLRRRQPFPRAGSALRAA